MLESVLRHIGSCLAAGFGYKVIFSYSCFIRGGFAMGGVDDGDNKSAYHDDDHGRYGGTNYYDIGRVGGAHGWVMKSRRAVMAMVSLMMMPNAMMAFEIVRNVF